MRRLAMVWLALTGCGFQGGHATSDGAQPGDGTLPPDSKVFMDAATDGKAPPVGWWDINWTRRSSIEIVNNSITAELDNFPVLVTLTPDTFDYDLAAAGGTDLRFVADDGTTLLDYDVDTFAAAGTTQVWVLVPAIVAAPAAHPTFFMYYANSAAPAAAAPQTVWHDYITVNHLGDTSDATGNGHTGSAPPSEALSTTTAGLLGSAQSFDGATQAFQLATPDDFNLTSFTVSLWVNSNAFTADYQCFVCKADSAWRLQRNNTGRDAEFGTTDSGGDNNLDGNSTVDDNKWHLITATLDASSAFKKSIYVDGIDEGNDNAAAVNATEDPVVIGNNVNSTPLANRFFDGLIDELHVTAQVRPPSWIAFEYKMIAAATKLSGSPLVIVHAAQPL